MEIMNITELRKQSKRNLILASIRSGDEISRFEVKKLTRFSMTTVLAFVTELLDDKLIYEEECNDSRIGRRPIWLKINPEGAYFVGLDFNAKSIYLSVLDFTYNEIFHLEDDCNGCEASEIMKKIERNIKAAIDYMGNASGRLMGIGLGVPGYIDKNEGIGLFYAHIKGYSNIPLKKPLEEKFKLPVILENNINAMAVGASDELPKMDNYIFISIRSGIRMSIFIDGKLYLGQSGTAGEIGHIRVHGGNRMCSCGKKGCLDTESSNTAIQNKIQEGLNLGRFKEYRDMIGDSEKFNMDLFLESVRMGHKDSLELVKEAAFYLGDVLAGVVNIFNPDAIVVTGDITRAGVPFMESMENAIRENVLYVNNKNLSIIQIDRDRFMGAQGAAMLVALQEFGLQEYNL